MSNREFYLEASGFIRQAIGKVLALKVTKEQQEALKMAQMAFEIEIWKCANIPDKEKS